MTITAKTTPTALLPGGTNYPQYGANSGSKFIPEIWSGKLQVKFYKSTVLGEITNNDWEGEIKNIGDKIYIRSIPTITINDYTKGQDLTNEAPESTPIDLTIDYAKYFSVVVDDVDAYQADVNLMDMFTNDASEQMKIAIDALVLSTVDGSASANNKGATAGVISGNVNLGKATAAVQIDSSTALSKILDCGLVLDEQNVPETGRWIIIPPWYAALLKKSELRQAYLTGDDTSPLRNGKLGMIDRFTVYVSNNLERTSDTGYKTSVLAGTRDAISFASQVTQVESIRSERTFGNIMRGLNVFGFKVTKPEALAVLYCYQ
jgi:N4-gp56 family major capsid protein